MNQLALLVIPMVLMSASVVWTKESLVKISDRSQPWYSSEEVVLPSEFSLDLSHRMDDQRSPQSTRFLNEIYRLLDEGDTESASVNLYRLTQDASSVRDRMHAKYLLGQVLMGMGMNEAASFQFIGVIKHGRSRFVDGSVEFLVLAANQMVDGTKINYAVSKLKDKKYQAGRRDIFQFRRGELESRKKKYRAAARRFSRVRASSPFFLKAVYQEALSYAQAKDEQRALRTIDRLLQMVKDRPATDNTKVTALLARARILYQKEDWSRAVAAYREIPRDSLFWHETLFEQSWAHMMATQFRSALSNFHSLHSPYYENFFIPESLILRALVYLYICQYEEVEKVVQLFEQIYTPLEAELASYLRRRTSSRELFEDFRDYVDHWTSSSDEKGAYDGPLPEMLARSMMKDAQMRQRYAYLQKLRDESTKIESASSFIRGSELGSYLDRLMSSRLAKAEARVGRRSQQLLREMRRSLLGFIEQNGFLRFELINVQKGRLRQKIAGEESEQRRTVDQEEKRSFYVQNGYNYWPFRGEYWLDEIGNYHYLGVQSCEK